MKADAARTFLMAIATMVISVIPTWRTQHEAYIQARLKLLTSLEEESILAALVADHAIRHDTTIETYHDPRYFITFDITASQPLDLPDEEKRDEKPPDPAAALSPLRTQPRDADGGIVPKHGSLLVEETLGLARDDPVEAEPVTQMFAGEGEVFVLHV